MRLLGISIENFLSFKNFEWWSLDPGLNLIVGPNGAGKTNLLRAVRAVSDVLSYESRHLWREASRCEANFASFRILLDFEFDGAWEREFLCAFVGAALWDQLSSPELQGGPPTNRGFNVADMERLAELARTALQPEKMSWLLRGRLGVEYEPDDNWSVWYESLPGEERRFRWLLEGPGGSGISAVEDANGSYSLSGILTNLPDGEWTALVGSLRGSAGLSSDVDVHRVLEQVSRRIVLQVQRPSSGILTAHHREFERLGGLRLEGQRSYDGRFVFQLIARRALVFTENVRRTPKLEFELKDLKSSAPIDLSDGQNLALFLFRLKNGAKHERQRYEDIGEMFRRLTAGSEFDVGLRDQTEVRNTNGENEKAVFLQLRVINGSCEIPLELSGAGVTESLFLSTIVEGTDNRAILLDEPALNLHPTTQSAVLKEIEARGQNQFVVITHSPVMIPADAISKVSRFALTDEGTRRSALDPSEWDPKHLARLQKDLRESLNVGSLLFSNGVILTEGETELGALPAWFEKECGQSLERSAVAIHWVHGDGDFEAYLRFVRGFGIPWAAICDGKVISYPIPHRPKNIAIQMKDAHVADLQDFDQLDFENRCAVLAKHGVFTLAKCGQDEFEALQVIKENQMEAERAVGSSKARRGRYIAERHDCPPEVAALFKQLRKHLRIGCRATGSTSGASFTGGELADRE